MLTKTYNQNFINNNIITYINSIKMDNINQLCNDSYFDDWHKRILRDDFVKFCTKYKY